MSDEPKPEELPVQQSPNDMTVMQMLASYSTCERWEGDL